MPNHYPEHLLFIKEYSEWENSDLAYFFRNEKPSEIKPPLLHIEYMHEFQNCTLKFALIVNHFESTISKPLLVLNSREGFRYNMVRYVKKINFLEELSSLPEANPSIKECRHGGEFFADNHLFRASTVLHRSSRDHS